MRLAILAMGVSLVVLAGCGSSDKGLSSKAVSPSQAKGASRVDVKHATDPGAALIDQTPRAISLEDFVALKAGAAKGDLGTDFKDSRVDPIETSTYEVEATIKSVVQRKDGDYYMVVQGDHGADAIVEVPDPNLCKNSPLHDKIASTRKALEERYHPNSDVKEVNEKATIDGVGFLGWRGKPGSNKPRLMPGTGVHFKDEKKDEAPAKKS